MQQCNATLKLPSWWGAMTSVFAFSGVHTNPNTETHRVAVFFIHPGTWFWKSAFTGIENAGLVWTVGPNATRLMRFHQKNVSVRTGPRICVTPVFNL